MSSPQPEAAKNIISAVKKWNPDARAAVAQYPNSTGLQGTGIAYVNICWEVKK